MTARLAGAAVKRRATERLTPILVLVTSTALKRFVRPALAPRYGRSGPELKADEAGRGGLD